MAEDKALKKKPDRPHYKPTGNNKKILTRDEVLQLLAEIALGDDETAQASQRIRALEAIARIEGFDKSLKAPAVLPLWQVARQLNKALGIPASMNLIDFTENIEDAELLPTVSSEVDNRRELI